LYVAVVVLAGLFLLLLVVLAFVAFKTLAARDASGNVTAPGCLNGCAVAAALTALGVLGIFTFAAAVAAIGAKGPLAQEVRKIVERQRERAEQEHDRAVRREREEREWGEEGRERVEQALDEPSERAAPSGPRLRVVLEARDHVEVPEELLESLSEAGAGEDFEVVLDHLVDESGNDVTLVELTMPAEGRDLNEIERAVAEVLDDPERNGDSDFELRQVEVLP
jgi:hypothetical protein